MGASHTMMGASHTMMGASYSMMGASYSMMGAQLNYFVYLLVILRREAYNQLYHNNLLYFTY
jgi:hypothetical protein